VIADSGVLASLVLFERRESDTVLVAQATTLAASIEDQNGQVAFDRNDLPGETPSGVAVDAAVVDASGPVAQTPVQPLNNATLLQLGRQVVRTGGPVWADLVDARGILRRAYAAPLPASGSGTARVLVVSRSVSEQLGALRRTALLLGLLSSGVVVVGALLAYRLAGQALRPVRKIATLARSLSEHDLHRRVDVRVPRDELGELVDTFNAMLARLEGAFESLRRFTADASHELRAPLAVMSVELEHSLSRARTQAEYRQSQETLRREVDHLARLADQLLILARADAGGLAVAPERIDVADFLHETAGRWEATAERKGVTVEVSAPAAGWVEADPALIRRVLDNLLDNAIRHTAPGTDVLLRGGRAGRIGWTFEVADHGPGIPLANRDRLFTRFGRADEARPRDGSGAGLGLALSAAIATAHGGSLSLVGDDGSGATFRLDLPGSEDRKVVEARAWSARHRPALGHGGQSDWSRPDRRPRGGGRVDLDSC
jgi:heavy metal sensor kinase